MPVSSLIIRKQLNADQHDLADLIQELKLTGGKSTPYPQLPDKFYCFLKPGHKMGKAEPLFRPIKDDEVKLLKVRFAGKQDEAAAAVADVGDKKKVKKEKKPKESKPKDETASGADATPAAEGDVKKKEKKQKEVKQKTETTEVKVEKTTE